MEKICGLSMPGSSFPTGPICPGGVEGASLLLCSCGESKHERFLRKKKGSGVRREEPQGMREIGGGVLPSRGN